MRIDAHQHFWTTARDDYGWLTPASAPSLYRNFQPQDLHPRLQAAAIAGTIAVQAAPTVAETDYLLGLAERFPWVLGVVGWIDFDAADAASELGRLARNPRFVGVRPMLQDLPDPDWILARTRASVLEMLAGRGLVFDALVRPVHLPRIADLATRHPGLAVVIDHAAKPAIGDAALFSQWRDGVRALASRQNVACKLSGLLTEAPSAAGLELIEPYFKVLLEAFGEDRLIWGSDWPVLLAASPYAEWSLMCDRLLEPYGTGIAAKVRGANAVRIYNLAGASAGHVVTEGKPL